MPTEHPAHIHIDHRNRSPKCECGDSSGGVIADSRQREKIVDGIGDLAAVTRNDDSRSLFEPQCPSWVAKFAPGPQHLVGVRCSEVGRLRPTLHPLVPPRSDASDRRLLAHHFADENAPRGSSGTAPRQVTGVLPEPVNNFNTIYASTPVWGEA